MARSLDTIIILPIPKNGKLKIFENYRTVSMISHASNILLRIILNRLNSMVECILAEEQAGFRKKKKHDGTHVSH